MIFSFHSKLLSPGCRPGRGVIKKEEGMRTANPALNNKTFSNFGESTDSRMTLMGTVHKTGNPYRKRTKQDL